MAIGKVIKGDAAPSEHVGEARPVLRPPRAGVVNAEVYEAHQSAQAIIEGARRQAEEIVAAAEAEKDRIHEEARSQGHQEGLAQVTELMVRARLLRSEVLQNAENEILALACKVAEKIIGRDLEREPELVVDICSAAIENVRGAQQVVVRVNPQDAAILRERRKRMMELIGRVKEIAIKEDAEVPRYGCIIETDSGTIDAQLATQLEMLRNVLVTDNAKREGPA